MNPQNIRLCHFYDERLYCKLQDYFGSFDYQNRYDEPIKKPINDFTITNYEMDEFTQKEDYKELSFVNDFLTPGILNINVVYIDNFRNEINNKGLYTPELLDGYAKFYRNRIEQIINDIRAANFHNGRIKGLVMLQINIIKEYTEEYFANPYPLIKNKIQFNWSKTKLIYFFHLIRSNKQIAWIEDADLGRIIDNIFEFTNPYNNNNYSPISESRKFFNAFKNVEGRPEKKVNDELNALFTDPDFYNI